MGAYGRPILPLGLANNKRDEPARPREGRPWRCRVWRLAADRLRCCWRGAVPAHGARIIRPGRSPSSIRSRPAAAPTCWRGWWRGKLEQRLGKSFVIENKTGAGSIIAAVAVQKSAPDGYTLLMAPTPTMAVNVSLYKSLPYEPLTDFVPLALLAQTPFVLVVNPALPVKSVPELLAYAKANAGKMSFASVGPGVPHHLFMEMFKSMTGIEASHVPYRGSLPALNDVVAGHVPMMFCRSRAGDRRAASRHGAAARHLVAVPRSRLHRHSAARRSRRAGLRSGGLADDRRAGARRRARSSTGSIAS